jgi:hypothetical protein
MDDLKTKYSVDGQQMEKYLKTRFISVSITFSIAMLFIMTMLGFNFYKSIGIEGLWILLFSLPVLATAFLYGVKRWHDKLRELADNKFILTEDRIIRIKGNQIERAFFFSEIAVIDKKKFGTAILKGGIWTKIDYYRPKRSPHQLDDPKLIFVPIITTDYLELIEKLKEAKRLRR